MYSHKRKIIDGTKEEQLHTKMTHKIKLYRRALFFANLSRSSLIVLFLRFFVVHRSLKSALERQREKVTHANVITTQGFEYRKNHALLATRSHNR
jgi:hypothetical protein